MATALLASVIILILSLSVLNLLDKVYALKKENDELALDYESIVIDNSMVQEDFRVDYLRVKKLRKENKQLKKDNRNLKELYEILCDLHHETNKKAVKAALSLPISNLSFQQIDAIDENLDMIRNNLSTERDEIISAINSGITEPQEKPSFLDSVSSFRGEESMSAEELAYWAGE